MWPLRRSEARPRRISRPVGFLEALESRLALAGINQVAVFEGSLASVANEATFPLNIGAGTFSLGEEAISLGFHVRSLESLDFDPAAVIIRRSDNSIVPLGLSVADLGGSVDSLAIASLAPGYYMLAVLGEGGTRGRFRLEAYLIGDVDGNGSIEAADAAQLTSTYGATRASDAYLESADADLDGTVSLSDLARLQGNLGATALFDPLFLFTRLDPKPIEQPSGVLTINNGSNAIVGATRAMTTVSVELDGDGLFDEGTTTADQDGLFSLPVSLADGHRAILVRASDGLGQQRFSAVEVTVDSHVPNPPVFHLHSDSDTGAADDVTTRRFVVLSGTTEPGATVLLDGTNLSTVAAADGSFTLADVPLAFGLQRLTIRARDIAGNESTHEGGITRIAPEEVDPPHIDWDLLWDTGVGLGESDQTTWFGGISVSLNDMSAISQLSFFGPGGQELLPRLDEFNNFVLSPEELEFELGHSLVQGMNTITLTVVDEWGNRTDQTMSFLRDSIAPFEPAYTIDPAFDTGDPGDHQTDSPFIRIEGYTDSLARVRLDEYDRWTESDASGYYSFDNVPLRFAVNFPTVTVFDAADNSTSFYDELYRFIPDVDVAGPDLSIWLTGTSIREGETPWTNQPAVRGLAIDLTDVSALSARFENAPQTVAASLLLGDLSPDGFFALDEARLETLYGAPLTDGPYSLVVVAQDSLGHTSQFTLAFEVDRSGPAVEITSILEGGIARPTFLLKGMVDSGDAPVVAVEYQWQQRPAYPLDFNNASGEFSGSPQMIGLIPRVQNLSVRAIDAAGNRSEQTISVLVSAQSLGEFFVYQTTPQNGALDIGVNQQVRVDFTEPVDPATLTTTSFYAKHNGVKLPAEISISRDRMSAWLAFAAPLPGDAEVEVTLEGNRVRTHKLHSLITDNATPNFEVFRFHTAKVNTVDNATLVGRIVGPGLDRIPYTADDFSPGLDGTAGTQDDVYFWPVAGAQVYFVGREFDSIETNAEGEFVQEDAPAGGGVVVVDASLSGAATGYYPRMHVPVSIAANSSTSLTASGAPLYLADVTNDHRTYFNATQAARMPLVDDAALDLPADERAWMFLDIAANSSVDASGNPVAEAWSGIAVLPPAVLRQILPAGPLQDAFGFLVEHDWFARFSATVKLSLPNVFDQPPGTRLTLLAQDKSTGQMAPAGIGVVSDDGTHVTSKLDAKLFEPGIMALAPPGMYVGTPIARDNGDPVVEPAKIPSNLPFPIPGVGFSPEPVFYGPAQSPAGPQTPEHCRSPGDGPPPPGGAPVVASSATWRITGTVNGKPTDDKSPPDHLFYKDGGSLTLVFRASPAEDKNDCYNFAPVDVKVEFDTKTFDLFLESELKNGESIPLSVASPEKTFTIKLKPLESKADSDKKVYAKDQLFGVKFKIFEKRKDDVFREQGGFTTLRLVDSGDKKHNDGKLSMPRVANGAQHNRDLDVHLAPGMTAPVVKLFPDDSKAPSSGAAGGDFSGYFESRFGPTSGILTFKPLGEQFSDHMNGTGASAKLRFERGPGVYYDEDLIVEGDARNEYVFLDVAALNATAVSMEAAFRSKGLNAVITADLKNPGFGDDILRRVKNFIESAFGKAVIVDSSPHAGAIQVNHFTTVMGHASTPKKRGESIVGVAWESLSELDKVGDAAITNFLNLYNNTNPTSFAYQLAQGINRKFGEKVDIYLDNFLVKCPTANCTEAQLVARNYVNTSGLLAQLVATVIVHEVGHNLSLRHTGAKVGHLLGIPGFATEVMTQSGSSHVFSLTQQLAKMAVGANWNNDRVSDALEKYLKPVQFSTKNYGFQVHPDEEFHEDDSGWEYPDDPIGPWLHVAAATDVLFPTVEQADFGTVIAAGNGTALATKTYHIVNAGDDDLMLGEISIEGEGFSVSGPSPGTVIASGNSLPILVTFRPHHTGAFDAAISIGSNSILGDFVISSTAEVVSPGGDVRLDLPNNNLGGVALSAAPQASDAFATIRNVGLAPLVVTGIEIVGGAGQFAVDRLPAAFGPANPIVIAPGREYSLSVSFDAHALGLQNARLVLNTNDADTPVITTTLVATGLSDNDAALDLSRNYVAVRATDDTGTADYRMRTDGLGHWNVFLRPESEFRYAVFDAASGLIYSGIDTTAESARPRFAGVADKYAASTEPDSDGDGLPDDIEFALGTQADSTDSDGDGILDFDEFDFGALPPSDPPPTPLSPLVYNANNFAVSVTVVDGPAATDHSYAYVGAFRGGLAVYDVNDPATPIALGTVPLPGFVIGVDADPATQTLAVAGETGLHIFSIANPALPTLVRSIVTGTGGAQFVTLHEGAAYLTAGNDVVGYTLKKVELATGATLQSIPLNTPGTPQNVSGFVQDGNFIYTMNRVSNVLRVFDISGPTIVARGSLVLNGGSGGLAVRNGVAYIGNTFRLDNIFATAWGYSTVNISDPDHPALIAAFIDAPHPQVPGGSIVVGDSGMAVMGGTIGTTFTGLKVVDVSNPMATSLTNTFARPLPPQITAIGDGRVFVPALQNGLEAIDFLAADTVGSPPVVTLATNAVDVNPAKPGIQIYEGTLVRIDATSDDNSLTRGVDILSNGQAVLRDVQPHYDEFALTAAAVGPAGSLWALQARGLDRAGNAGLSAVTTLEIVPIAPRIVSTFPAPAAQTRELTDALSVTFSEAMNTAPLSLADFHLVAAGTDDTFGTPDDQTIAITAIEPSADRRSVRVKLAGPLAPGRYRFSVDDQWLADVQGNQLDGELTASLPSGNGAAGGDFTARFTVLPPPTMPASQFAGELFPLYPFEPRTIDNYTRPVGPLLTADVTGDGLIDAVQLVSHTLLVDGGGGTTYTAGTYVSVLPGLSNGGFGAANLSRVMTGAERIALGDVDRDGRLDVVVAGAVAADASHATSHAPVVAYFGRSGGQFETGATLADAANTTGVDGLIIEDLNRDGRLDVAMLAHGPGYNYVADFLGDGFGAFDVRNVHVLSSFLSDARLWAADFDSDGFVDLATDRRLLMNTGSVFTESMPLPIGQSIRAVADFTGDGRADLLAERPHPSTGRTLVGMLEGTAGGSFLPHTELDIGTGISAATYLAADFTADGRADFAVITKGPAFSGGELLQVTSGPGGTLSESSRRVLGTMPEALASAVLAGDAARDLLATLHFTALSDAAAVAVFAGTASGRVETPRLGTTVLEHVAVGDFNGDLKLDRVGYDAQVPARKLYLELGNGDGTFQSPITISSWSSNFEPAAPIAADVNGDGKLDLLAASGFGGNGVYYYRGRGDGTFDSAVLLFSTVVDSYFLADMNQDSRLDAVLKSSYRLQNADGTFAAPVGLSVPSAVSGTIAWGVGDVNGDGRPDLVAADASSVIVLVNQSGLTFAPTITSGLLATQSPRRLTLSDVNGDGRADMFVIKFTDGTPQLLLGNADGTFRTGFDLGEIGGATAVAIGDLNGDMLSDAVFSTGFGLEALLGNGDGTFQVPQRRHLAARRAHHIALGDVDGDGLLDVLAANIVLRRR